VLKVHSRTLAHDGVLPGRVTPAAALSERPLSREELDFIGSYERRRSGRGWHQPDQVAALRPLYEIDVEPSAEDSTILSALMMAGHQDRLESLA
jgi:hypothetical protein